MSTQENSTAWREVPEAKDRPGYSLFCQPVQKPDIDDRDYRLIRLQNGILALLVHDGRADKAAGSLSIAVGHLQDPDDVPGLAHFLEHMLQKGSVPFPAENDWAKFISSNGGSRNAGTSAAFQDYWFSINPPHLAGALTRLAACFHSPLFTSSLTSREMHAVDSENKRNLQNDVRRILQLNKFLSIPGHPWSKFGTGNLESLTETARKKLENENSSQEVEDGDGGPIGREVRKRLVKWWEEEYCASRMSLCVLGNESIEELTDLVTTLYSPIPNRWLHPRPVFAGPVWGSEQKGSIVFVKTVKDYHAFSLTFQIPDQAPLYRTRPADYIAHFLGHEGPGSIFAYLKARGWILDISAGCTARNRSVTRFSIEGKLTQEGYLHYEDVVLTIFKYLSLLRASPLDSYHFDQMKQLSAISFSFQEKSQPHAFVRSVSLAMLDSFEPQHILSGGALSRVWDEPAVRRILETLRPENGRIVVMAMDHEPCIVGEDELWDTEKWYGTRYRVIRMSEAFLHRANSPHENSYIFLPRPNPYVPEKLVVNRIDVEEVARAPRQIRTTPLSTLWHKADDQFWVPKAQVKIAIKSPVAYSTPRNAVLTRLFVDLLEDSLSEVTYDAGLAGLHYSVSNTSTGLTITVRGYDDKLPLLLDTVLERLQTIQFQSDRLKVKSEQLGRSYKNFYLGQPSNLAQDFTSFILKANIWTPEEKSAELPYVTLDDLRWHKKEVLSKIHLELLVTGNVAETRALEIQDAVETRLNCRRLPPAEWPRDRSLLLPPGSNYVVQKVHANPKEMNSALTHYCQFGDISETHLRALLRLLVHIVAEPAFTQLRTKEQLGYVVATTVWLLTGSMGLGFKIQSLKSPAFLEERVNAFITTYRDTLVSLDLESFNLRKQGLVDKLLERPKNLSEETSTFWSQIDIGYYDFLQNTNDAKVIKKLTLSELVEAYDKYLMPHAVTRKKLSLHLLSQQVQPGQVSNAHGTVFIKDEATWKASLIFSSAAVMGLEGTTV